ncbi:MAG: DUF2179 domain-containing protein [Campylobacteraceae bacterium]|jgi:uncharacterized protein YebE (UPF0316 family)|nr:DUF2179 domain-containing protein [Campylobacteraceae bacterium]
MEFADIFQSEAFKLYGIPMLICLARITDVTIGTMRIIFISKGMKYLAPFIGFFEICIWLAAITQVMENLNHISNFFAYALGYSIGNFLGIFIEGKLAIGTVVVRIITKKDSHELAKTLRKQGYSVTVLDAQGNTGAVNVVFTVIKRADVPKILPIILHYNPNAVYSIEDIRYISEYGLPSNEAKTKRNIVNFLTRGIRK